jgi:hypothetical protein
MPDLPSRIRLAAGDYFMHGQDRRMRQSGLPGNVCRVALKLGPGLDTDLLRQRVAASPILDWLARVRITRSLPIPLPVWRAVAERRMVLREHNGQEAGGEGLDHLPTGVLGRDLHAGQGPALGLDLVRRADETRHFVLSWNHALMDARGAELILRHLDAGDQVKDPPSIGDMIAPGQRNGGLARWCRDVRLARGSVKWLNTSGSEPLFTLMPAGRGAGPCHGLTRLVPFTREETARIDERCERLNAGFRRSHFYLAASIQALHAVASGRGNKDGAYLIPVPHDTRPRGSNGPIFSNHLSILFYRIEPRQAASLSGIIEELSRQMMDQIRTRFPECCMAALGMFKPLPLDSYVSHLGKPTRGKFASFCFSDSGETCAGMTGLLGAPIQAVTHLIPTWRPPGLTVLFWRFGGQLRVWLAWVDDCLSLAEADILERRLRSGLLEEES